eukprot:251709_1
MTAPERTTFEVTVSNKLPYNAAYVQIQAELHYATHLTSSFNNNNAQKTYQKTSQSDQKSNQYAHSSTVHTAESKYENNTTHNKTSSSSYDSNAQSTKVSSGVLIPGIGAASTDVSHLSSKTKLQSESTDNFTNNITSSSYSAFNATSDSGANASANAALNQSSNECNKGKSGSSSSTLQSSKITPGFVRIVCRQSLSIPVIVDSKSQIVYITVYIEDCKTRNRICIANALQINRQHIEIKRNLENNDIMLQPAEKNTSYS